jgi:hypothetical protein
MLKATYQHSAQREYSKAQIAVRGHRIAVRGSRKFGTITLSATFDNGELSPDTACYQNSLEVLAGFYKTLKTLLSSVAQQLTVAISIWRTRLPLKKTFWKTWLEKCLGQ